MSDEDESDTDRYHAPPSIEEGMNMITEDQRLIYLAREIDKSNCRIAHIGNMSHGNKRWRVDYEKKRNWMHSGKAEIFKWIMIATAIASGMTSCVGSI